MARHPDDTVIMRPPAARRGRGLALAAAGLLLAGAAAGWWATRTQPAPVPREVAPVETPEPIPTASEAAIRAESPAVRTVLRLQANPAVVVIDFPTLAEQGRMFNRLAAWAEKAGVAHDRVPTEETLAVAIASSGATPETYYYGHDYSGSAVERFFALAAQAGLALRPEEADLQRIARRAAAEPAGFGAVISVVRADAGPGVTPQARATILHHEISHGQYFTDSAYARYVTGFWQNVLTAPERAAFRAYLAQEGYDPALEDLMRNETQAYLMHTPDPAFFEPARLAIPAGRLAQLRAEFLQGMPPGWLRDDVAASGIVPAAPVSGTAPTAHKRRRRQRAGRVSIGRAAAATLPPRRRRVSIADRRAAR